MSGGVDSSVAAYILQQRGYDVTGVYMKNWDPRDDGARCSVDDDQADAEFVCRKLGIPFKTVDFVKSYWHNVFSPMLEEYQKGSTPNPDVMCNRFIKFGKFHRYAVERMGADAVATGHYARLRALPGAGVELYRGVDPVKDQSLFLSQVDDKALRQALFPLGDMTKVQVKQLAQKIGLHRVVSKKESMGICFIGKQDFQSFVSKYIEPQQGTFEDIETGKVLGLHSGVHCWTPGQRCHMGGLKQAYYVAHLCPETQRILVAAGRNHPSLYWRSMRTGQPHWIGRPPLVRGGNEVETLFRSQHKDEPVPCSVTWEDTGYLKITLNQHRRAITTGQFAVLYGKDGRCFGSAKIAELGPSLYEEQLKSRLKSAYS